MGCNAEALKKDIVTMLDRMTPQELSMIYSLARHIDTRPTATKKAPRQ